MHAGTTQAARRRRWWFEVINSTVGSVGEGIHSVELGNVRLVALVGTLRVVEALGKVILP